MPLPAGTVPFEESSELRSASQLGRCRTVITHIDDADGPHLWGRYFSYRGK